MKKAALLLVLSAALASSLFGLEVKDGRIKLVIDERSGRFALHYLADVAKNTYVPLLYAQETRTTFTTLLVDQKSYKLGDASEFRTTVSREAAGAIKIEYRSSFCVVTQTLAFVRSPGAAMSDGMTMTFSIENVSQKDASLGLRILLDSWLGEKAQAHFATDKIDAISVETVLSGDYNDTWIRSPSEILVDGSGLQVLLMSPATRPDKVLAANWKRLNDASWSFDVSSARNFTLLPYSINDSALALYYEPLLVRPGSSRSVVTLMGQANDGYKKNADTDVASSVVISKFTVPSETDPLDEMTDLVAVRSVLEALNAAMDTGVAPSQEDLLQLETTLKRLEARKGKY
jgi:hypothetical protein